MAASGRSVVAIDLGGTKIAAALVDATGRIRRRAVEPVDRTSARAIVDQLVSIAKRFDDAAAVGICVPGLVRPNGTVWAPNLPGWDSLPLAGLMRRRAGLPVFVESDRNAVVLGETWRGAAKNKKDAIVLIVGTGIGAGIMSGGRLLRGAHELSGCAGWLVVTDERNDQSRRCGSLEALVAGPAIANAFDGTTAAAAAAARAGDARALQIFGRAGRLLGVAIANLISLLDPEIVVLTGGMTSTADLTIDHIRRVVSEFAQPLSAPEVQIVVSKLQTDANLLGAARLALDGLGAATVPSSRKRAAAKRSRAARGTARTPAKKKIQRRKSTR